VRSLESGSSRFSAQGHILPDSLTPEERAAVETLSIGPATFPVAKLAKHQLPKTDAQYLERLEKDWREKALR
jgi:hypothetical protein